MMMCTYAVQIPNLAYTMGMGTQYPHADESRRTTWCIMIVGTGHIKSGHTKNASVGSAQVD